MRERARSATIKYEPPYKRITITAGRRLLLLIMVIVQQQTD